MARFSGDQQPVTGKTVTYNGGISTGTSLSYAWTTSDGRTANGSVAQFAFNSPGTYTVYLTVNDSIGRYSVASATIYVQAVNNGTAPGQPTGADPVVLSSGNYIQQRVDLKLPGKGLPFEFTRYYNSKFGDQTGLPLGFGWTHTYNEHLNNTGTNVLDVRGDGSTWTFFPSGGGYTNQPGFYDNLVSNVDNTSSVTDKSQTVKRFDSTGHLMSITDKNGNVLNLSYIGGVLRQIQDTAGRTILLNTNSFGCISQITDPIGRTIIFQYDSNTNLVSVTDANGQTSTNVYDSNHQLTDAFDAKGNHYVHNEYDTNSFVVLRQCDAFTNWTFFGYFTNQPITYETNALGNVSIHTFDENLLETNVVDELGNQQSFAYDNNRNRILVKDKNGNPTSYGYDANGNVTNKTDALNGVTAIEYNSANNPTKRADALTQSTRFAYDTSGNLTQTTNALGQVSSVAYDASGLPQILTDANGHSTTNTFDAQGNLIKVQDTLGNTTTFGYDGAGRKIAQTNANNQVTRYFYDNNDNLIRVVDSLNGTNSYIYDANNKRIVTIDARGAATTNIYDPKDRLVIVQDSMGDSVTNDYDALDRKIRVWDAMGGVTQFGYDADGNLLAVTNATGGVTLYAYDPNGNRTNVVDALGNSTANVFDSLNRLVSTKDPLGHTATSVYDALGRRIQGIDALNRTNFFAYDSMGRLTNFTDTAGGTVRYTYDNVGNRTSIIDPNGHANTNVFDALNRLVKTTDPDGGVVQLGYDAVGNLISRKDPDGNTTTYQYDGNNHRTKIIYPTGAPVTFGYDANGNRTNMVDALGTTTYSYDALNRLVSVSDCYGKTVSYGYDKNGNRASVTYPGNKTVHYIYDATNRLKSVTDWLNNTTTYNYDADGNLTSSINPNGTSAFYHYDLANRLIALTNADNSSIISSYQYTLDAVGNHSQVNQTEQLPTGIPVVGQLAYAYDSDNRMTDSEGQTQSFDANGNMISINPTSLLAYDYENRLTQTSFAGTTNIYQYDGVGNRMSASRGGVVSRYVLDRNSPLSQVLAETDSSGNIIYYYIYGLGLISRIDTNNNTEFYHYDSRGSTIALTDARGQIVEAYAYDPFGRPINGIPSDNRFRYLGRHGVMDEENGLLYVRARYCSTKRGRFITKDPTTGKDGDSQSLNRYIYALNNPVRLIDITGFSAQEISHVILNFATSDNILSHNLLISPSTGGLATSTANSTVPYILSLKTPSPGTFISEAPTLTPEQQQQNNNLVNGFNNDSTFLADTIGLVPGLLSKDVPEAGVLLDVISDQQNWNGKIQSFSDQVTYSLLVQNSIGRSVLETTGSVTGFIDSIDSALQSIGLPQAKSVVDLILSGQ